MIKLKNIPPMEYQVAENQDPELWVENCTWVVCTNTNGRDTPAVGETYLIGIFSDTLFLLNARYPNAIGGTLRRKDFLRVELVESNKKPDS